MKRTNTQLAALLLALGVSVAGVAAAQSSAQPHQQSSAQSSGALPPVQTQGDVSYVTGGIGLTESSAMKAAAASYPLSLEFVKRATPNGVYLANVDVTIKNHSGDTVLQTTADGPFLLAKLPAGRYTVLAQVDGQTKTRSVVTGHRPKEVIMTW